MCMVPVPESCPETFSLYESIKTSEKKTTTKEMIEHRNDGEEQWKDDQVVKVGCMRIDARQTTVRKVPVYVGSRTKKKEMCGQSSTNSYEIKRGESCDQKAEDGKNIVWTRWKKDERRVLVNA